MPESSAADVPAAAADAAHRRLASKVVNLGTDTVHCDIDLGVELDFRERFAVRRIAVEACARLACGLLLAVCSAQADGKASETLGEADVMSYPRTNA
jgi:hypothetical protein